MYINNTKQIASGASKASRGDAMDCVFAACLVQTNQANVATAILRLNQAWSARLH